MMKFTGEMDDDELPVTKKVMKWDYFNSDFAASQSKFEEVRDLCLKFEKEFIDLRPYMLEDPYTVSTVDKLPKVLDLFRHFHLRALPVIDPNHGLPVAILTRQDIFSYMSL